MKRGLAILSVLFALVLMPLQGSQAASHSACTAPIQGLINLPADDAVHPLTPYSWEWWFYAMHVKAEDGRRFGIMKVVYLALVPTETGELYPLQWTDTTVTDRSEGAYHFSGRQVEIGAPAQIENGFELTIGTDHVAGGDGHDEIQAVDDDGHRRYVVDVRLDAEKAPVVQLAGGYNYYYTRERMKTKGTLTVDGQPLSVSGYGWFEHQYGDQKIGFADLSNWTWMALQLENHRELLVLLVNFGDGSQVAMANLTAPNCETTRYGAGQFTVTPTGSWVPPDKACVYQMGWDVRIPAAGLDVHVAPVIENQDIVVPGWDRYWEGDSIITGSERGDAFVEQFGICPW